MKRRKRKRRTVKAVGVALSRLWDRAVDGVLFAASKRKNAPVVVGLYDDSARYTWVVPQQGDNVVPENYPNAKPNSRLSYVQAVALGYSGAARSGAATARVDRAVLLDVLQRMDNTTTLYLTTVPHAAYDESREPETAVLLCTDTDAVCLLQPAESTVNGLPVAYHRNTPQGRAAYRQRCEAWREIDGTLQGVHDAGAGKTKRKRRIRKRV